MLQPGGKLMPHVQAGSLIEDSLAGRGGRKGLTLVALPRHQAVHLIKNQERLRWASPIWIFMHIACLVQVHNSQVWFAVLGDSGKRNVTLAFQGLLG